MNMQMAPPTGGDPIGTIVVIAGAIATLYAFIVAVRATIAPGEARGDHPKNIILRADR